MIKLVASFSKKLPAEVDYSSQSFLASVEVELPAGLEGKELQDKIHNTFNLVKQSVEDEIAGKAGNEAGQNSHGSQESTEASVGVASEKQLSYLLDLAKARKGGLQASCQRDGQWTLPNG